MICLEKAISHQLRGRRMSPSCSLLDWEQLCVIPNWCGESLGQNSPALPSKVTRWAWLRAQSQSCLPSWLSHRSAGESILGAASPPLPFSLHGVRCTFQSPQSHSGAVPVPLAQPPAQQQGKMPQGHGFRLKKWN